MVEWVQNVVHSFKRVPTKRGNEKRIRRPPFNEKTTTDKRRATPIVANGGKPSQIEREKEKKRKREREKEEKESEEEEEERKREREEKGE